MSFYPVMMEVIRINASRLKGGVILKFDSYEDEEKEDEEIKTVVEEEDEENDDYDEDSREFFPESEDEEESDSDSELDSEKESDLEGKESIEEDEDRIEEDEPEEKEDEDETESESEDEIKTLEEEIEDLNEYLETDPHDPIPELSRDLKSLTVKRKRDEMDREDEELDPVKVKISKIDKIEVIDEDDEGENNVLERLETTKEELHAKLDKGDKDLLEKKIYFETLDSLVTTIDCEWMEMNKKKEVEFQNILKEMSIKFYDTETTLEEGDIYNIFEEDENRFSLERIKEIYQEFHEKVKKLVEDDPELKKAYIEFMQLESIRAEQKNTDLTIKQSNFKRLCEEILYDLPGAGQGVERFDPEALEMLQTISEDYLVNLFEGSNLLCIYRRSDKLEPKDMAMARRLKGWNW